MQLIITKYLKDSVWIIPILAIYALLHGFCFTAAFKASLLAGACTVCGRCAFKSALHSYFHRETAAVMRAD
jgi:hypothetical protein